MTTRSDKAHPKFTVQEVIDALAAAGGLMSVAARTLGCHADTVRNYVRRYPRVQAALVAAREALKDEAEAGLHQLIRQRDLAAIKYYLSTQGRDRGYVERADYRLGIGGDPDNPAPLRITTLTVIPPAEAPDGGSGPGSA